MNPRQSFQNKPRQSRRHKNIFDDISHRNHVQNKPEIDFISPNRPIQKQQTPPPPELQLLKLSLQTLTSQASQLKELLLLQKQKYEKLLVEYEQLVQNNHIIEQQYISLKYEHKKNTIAQMNKMKADLLQKIDKNIKESIEGFMISINGFTIEKNMMNEIDEFLKQLLSITIVYTEQKNKKSILYIPLINKTIHSQKIKKQREEDQNFNCINNPPATEELQSNNLIEPSSPKIREFQNEAEVPLSQTSVTKQPEFENEYYGELEEYDLLQEKVKQRKNYELLKNCIRARTSEARRKKIFSSDTNNQS